jgi:hypothetical protein
MQCHYITRKQAYSGNEIGSLRGRPYEIGRVADCRVACEQAFIQVGLVIINACLQEG